MYLELMLCCSVLQAGTETIVAIDVSSLSNIVPNIHVTWSTRFPGMAALRRELCQMPALIVSTYS